jgi:ABC-type polysaccharide/polyol phosphate export permease/GT2 family glycosyltransferase
MSAKIVEMDIHRPRRIDNLEGYDAVEIYFRSKRDLIGKTRIPCDQESVSQEKIQSLIKDLSLPSRPEFATDKLPSITVAICTCNRSESLANALRSVERQKYPPSEVIVVDNCGETEVRSLVEEILPEAQYLIERRPGLDFARNHAISAARGDIVAFLDDDVQADPFWVLSIAESFSAFPEAGAVTGLILPLKLETHAQELFEANGGFGRGFSHRILPDDSQKKFGFKLPMIAEAIGVGSGCNMAFKTSVLKEMNGFDEALDTGPPLPGGGDLDMFYRVMREGYEHIYEPRALVRHRHRRSLAEVQAQLSGHYRALSAFLIKALGAARGWAWFGVALFLVWRLIKPGYRLVRGLIGRDALPLTLLVQIFVASLVGLGSYYASRRRIREYSRYACGKPPKLKGQLHELWCFRELIWNLTKRDLKVKYQRSWLGFLWTLLNPIITVGVLVTVFSYVIRIPIEHYWAFLISGYFAWNFFSQTLNGGVQAAVGNAYLTRSAYFPQEVLVLSAALARFLEFLGELLIILFLLVLFHHHGIPFSFIGTLPLILILFLLAMGISFPLVTLAVYYKDTIQIIPLLTLVLFYASPIFYHVDLIPEHVRSVYLLNPLALLMDLFHTVLYLGEFPKPIALFSLIGISILLALAGYIVFNFKKREFAEIV